MEQPKGILQSAIILNTIITMGAISVVSAIDPIAGLIKTFVPNDSIAATRIDYTVNIIKIISTSLGVGTGFSAISSRVAKGDIYTPKFLPGHNKSDLVELVAKQVEEPVPDIRIVPEKRIEADAPPYIQTVAAEPVLPRTEAASTNLVSDPSDAL